MKWITSARRVLAIAALLAAAARSRTVLPIAYAYGTVSDGDSQSTIRYGAHTTGPGRDAGAARHPARLAHHYYEPAQPAAAEEAPSGGADTTPASPGRRSRKRNEYVARVSYVRKAPDATTAAASRGEPARASTESIMSPVRLRKIGRRLRPRNEIPVNEEPTGEVPVVSGFQPTEANTERNLERGT